MDQRIREHFKTFAPTSTRLQPHPTVRESLLSILIVVHLTTGQEGTGMVSLARNSLVSRVCGSLSEADNVNG